MSTASRNPSGSRALSSRAVSTLRNAILDGRFVPGQRLTQEMLAEFIGTSRVPVREALKSLASEGLISLVENTGAWVTSYSQAQCVELYRVRERLEPLLLELSMPNLTDDDIDRIGVLCDMVDAASDVNAFIALDRELHFATYAGHREQFLHGTIVQLWNATQHYRRLFVGRQTAEVRRRLSAEHSLMLDAIRRRDTETAATVLELHIRRTRLSLSEADDLFDR